MGKKNKIKAIKISRKDRKAYEKLAYDLNKFMRDDNYQKAYETRNRMHEIMIKYNKVENNVKKQE